MKRRRANPPLMKDILAGVEQPNVGAHPSPNYIRSISEAAAHGIGIIFQMTLCPNF